MKKEAVFGLVVAVTMVAAGCDKNSVSEQKAAELGFRFEIENGAATITGYTGSAKDVEIPAQIGGKPVTTIGEDAFRDNRLTGITIPNSVTSIGYLAFSGNELTSVTFPDSVTSIGGLAFTNDPLTSVTIPANVDINQEGLYTAFPVSFSQAYLKGGSQAGTYTRSDSSSETWTKQ
jgi:hypothetical protein